METDEIIIFVITGIFIVSSIATQVTNDFNKIRLDIISLLSSKSAFIFYAIIFLLIIIYLNYKFHYWFIKKREKIKAKRKSVLENIKETKELLNKETEYVDSDKLKNYIKILKAKLEVIENSKKDHWLVDKIFNKINEIELKLPMIIKKEKVREIRIERDNLKDSIRELEEQEKRKLLDIRNLEDTSLRKLNADENPVFIEEDLTEKEKALLLKYNYKRAYEYCLDKQEFIHVLVKPTMKHSVTHTFLVWSAMKMLNKISGVRDVLDWDTKEADIIFKYNSKKFALEIETGTLLKKKSQLREKIDYLNSKYKDCWMIIVSKKNLVPKYSKFGKVSSRSEVPKKLKKLLKLAPLS